MSRTREDQKRIADFFSAKSKSRFREVGTYACEHYTDIRNSECPECLAELVAPRVKPPKTRPKRRKR